MSEQFQGSKEINAGMEGFTSKEFKGRKSTAKKVNLGVEGETPKKFIRSNSFEHRRVNVGLDGLTPKKVVNSDGTTRAYNFSKRVNVGAEGSTPIKTFEYFSNIPVAAAPNHFNFAQTAPAISSSMIRNTINSAGASKSGSKTNPFSNGKFNSRLNPEIETEIISPGGRPKTSRGKSHPSPDEFFDYVVPSPPPAKHGTDRLVLEDVDVVPSSSHLQTFSADPEDSDEVADNYDMMDGILEEDQDENQPEGDIEGEESVYEVNSFEGDGSEDDLQQRHIGMKGADEQRNKQIRMLGCWLFGSALRI